METATINDIQTLHLPQEGSHKGQNGRLLLIGGSHLFHAASLWSLTVASRIVDLVHYASVEENNELVSKMKEEFRNGIVIPRGDIESYIEEDDVILIGPGMTRDEETKHITEHLVGKYPLKKWVIDAGALQMIDLSLIPKQAILTPHHGEFEDLWKKLPEKTEGTMEERVQFLARTLECVVLLKGQEDILCSKETCTSISGGNEGMTKGGTGDVLAGLVAALACKNDPYLATLAGSFINKAAGDALYKTVGPFFNATDLAEEIPRTMKRLLIRESHQ